jgi:hypothetical protein
MEYPKTRVQLSLLPAVFDPMWHVSPVYVARSGRESWLDPALGARWLSPTVLCDPSLHFGLQFSFPGRQYDIHLI